MLYPDFTQELARRRRSRKSRAHSAAADQSGALPRGSGPACKLAPPRSWAWTWAALMRRVCDRCACLPELWRAAAGDRDGRGPRGNSRDPRRSARSSPLSPGRASGKGGRRRARPGSLPARGGARRLSGIRTPRSPKSVRWRLGGRHPSGPAPCSGRKSRDTLVVRAVPGGKSGGWGAGG